ncbi:MAG TPA: proton-conducting transporter membrane subunit, partial [Anaerolineae bacterium]
MDFIQSNILTLLVLAPILGAVLVLLAPAEQHRLIKWGAIAFSLVPLLLSVIMWASYSQTQAGFQFEQQTPWFPQINSSYHVGVDGISIPLIVLCALLTPLSMLMSLSIQKGVKAFFALFFLLEAAVIGVFVSLDLILFFVFFEISLVPMFFLINQWGGANRRYASFKFILYTMAASLGMLLAIQVLGLASKSFDLPYLFSPAGRPFSGVNQV